MPHPASSGTGYLTVAAWMQMMGEKEAWEFMDELHENIAVYTHSGSAPCVQAAKGERMAGIAFDMRGAAEKTKGAPIEIDRCRRKAPAGTWRRPAIVKGTKNLDARQEGRRLGREQGRRTSSTRSTTRSSPQPSVKNTPPNYPPTAEQAHGQERLRLDGREPRPDPGGMVEALRVQGGAEELTSGMVRRPTAKCGRDRVSIGSRPRISAIVGAEDRAMVGLR